jgi:VanZ family protein
MIQARERLAGRAAAALRWVVWGTFVAAWTHALLIPEPEAVARQILFPASASAANAERLDEKLALVSKPLHVVAYAVLTALSGWLGVRGQRRFILLLFLSMHGLMTEYLQHFVQGRHPSWGDAGLDHLGLVCGVILSWRWWFPATGTTAAVG